MRIARAALRTVRGAFMVSLGAVATVGAQEAEPEGAPRAAPPVTEIEVRASALDALARESPVSVEVLGPQEIRAVVPEVLTEALRGETGAHVQSTTPGQGSLYVRGLTGSSVLNLVDGIRLNHAIFRSAPNPYLALVDPDIVREVAVVRGPGSAVYGSDAMGGVVEVVTRRPRFEAPDWGWRGTASSRFGSADLSRSARAEVEGGRRGIGMRAGFSYFESEDVRGGGDTGLQEPTDYTWIGGDFALDVEPAERHETRLDFQYVEQPETPRYDALVAGFGQAEASSAVWQYEPLARLFAHARHTIRQPLPFVQTLALDAAYQRITDDRRTRDLGSVIEQREHNRSDLFGVTLRGTSLVGERASFAWGGEAYFDEVSSSRRERDLSLGTSTGVPSRFPDGSTMDSFGVFARGRFELTPSLALILGLRYSWFELRIGATPTTPSFRLDVDAVTGGLGLLWGVRPGVQLAGNVHRGFRAPNVFDLGTLGERPGNRFNVPSQDVREESIYTVDLGVKLEGERLALTLFGFYSYYDDRIQSVRTGETTPEGRDVVQSANVSEVELAGFEAGATYAIRPTLQLSTDAFYVWGEEHDDGGGQPADRIPPLQGRVGLRWSATPALWVESFALFALEQDRLSDRDRSDPRIDPHGTDAWATLNVRAGWTLSPRISGVVLLHNLTDASYREHGSGVQAPGIGVVLSLRTVF